LVAYNIFFAGNKITYYIIIIIIIIIITNDKFTTIYMPRNKIAAVTDGLGLAWRW